jgi:hypothetical protein
MVNSSNQTDRTNWTGGDQGRKNCLKFAGSDGEAVNIVDEDVNVAISAARVGEV